MDSGSGQSGLTARDTAGLELHGVGISAVRGPAFTIDNAAALELDGLANPKPVAGTPVLRLTGSPRAVIRNCRGRASDPR